VSKAGSWHKSSFNTHFKPFHSSPCKVVTIYVQNFDAVDVANRRVLLVGPDGLVSKQYDLLVGADGARSTVRPAIVKRDRHMKSQVSYVARMRYVTAIGLEAHPDWPDKRSTHITSPPLESLFQEPAVSTKGAHTTGTAQHEGSKFICPTRSPIMASALIVSDLMDVRDALDKRQRSCAFIA
jgi:hypothetical protein